MRSQSCALRWAAACMAVVCSAVAVAGSPTVLSPSLYYLFPAEGVTTDVQTVSQAVQSAGLADCVRDLRSALRRFHHGFQDVAGRHAVDFPREPPVSDALGRVFQEHDVLRIDLAQDLR